MANSKLLTMFEARIYIYSAQRSLFYAEAPQKDSIKGPNYAFMEEIVEIMEVSRDFGIDGTSALPIRSIRIENRRGGSFDDETIREI